MGVNYSDIENKQNANAQQQQADYNTRSDKAARSAARGISNAVQQSTAPVEANIRQQFDTQARQYQTLYDANAVQDAIARRMLEQQGGSPGAALNNTQSAALTAQHGTADVNAQNQQNTASQSLSDTLQALLADATANDMRQQAGVYYQAANDKSDFQSQANDLNAQKILNLYANALQQQYNNDSLANQKSEQDAQIQEAARQANADNQYNYDALDYQKQHDALALQKQKEEEEKQRQAEEKQRQMEEKQEQAAEKQEQEQKDFQDKFIKAIQSLGKNTTSSNSGTKQTNQSANTNQTVRSDQDYNWPSEELQEQANETLQNNADLFVTPKLGLPGQANPSLFTSDARAVCHVEGIKQKLANGEITQKQAAMSIIATIIKNSPEYKPNSMDKNGIYCLNEKDTTVAEIGYALRDAGLMSVASNFFVPGLNKWKLPELSN